MCPYCVKVVMFAKNNGIELDLCNIQDGTECLDELMEHGGKQQVPYLIDEEAGVAMYESNEIIAYLQKKHAK